MPVTVAKVHAMYDKPVEINKAMDSSTAECSNTTCVHMIFSKSFDINGKILIG